MSVGLQKLNEGCEELLVCFCSVEVAVCYSIEEGKVCR
jgi:hypothetical protein